MLCKFTRNCLRLARRLDCKPNEVKVDKKQLAHMQAQPEIRLKSDKSKDHLTRTKDSFRHHKDMNATVIDIEKLSPTVRGIKMIVSSTEQIENFKAGQWVDMTIPGISTVGGFSICSSPSELKNQGILEFAVKYADHPPAKWIHEQCHIGSTVTICFGGDFYYDSHKEQNEDLLLIAGGVGINPIYSILRERSDFICQKNSANQVSTTLLYCARTADELLFKDEIKEIRRVTSNTRTEMFVTQEDQSLHVECMHRGHITQEYLKNIVHSLHNGPVCYICGPPSFIDSMVEQLKNLGLQDEVIKYEKWW